MNKAELIEAISKDTSLPKKGIDAVIKSFTSIVSDTLQKWTPSSSSVSERLRLLKEKPEPDATLQLVKKSRLQQVRA